MRTNSIDQAIEGSFGGNLMSPSTAGTTYKEHRRSTTYRHNVTAYETMFQMGAENQADCGTRQTLDQEVPAIQIPSLVTTDKPNYNQSFLSTGMQWTSESKTRNAEQKSAFTQSLMSQTERKRGSCHTYGMNDSMYDQLVSRIPWADQTTHGDHKLQDLMRSGQYKYQERGDKVSDYNLSLHTPMSPIKRQQQTINQIKLMELKARHGSQPTAKEYTHQIMIRKSLYQPDEIQSRPFVQSGARKPITSYKFLKFKESQGLAGFEFSEDFRYRKGSVKRQDNAKLMRFKKEEMSLYNGPDAHIGDSHSRRKSKFNVGNDSEDSQTCRDIRMDDMAKGKGILDDRYNKYHLFTNKKGREELMKNIENKVSERKPSVDISEICDQFYNKGYPNDWNQLPESMLVKVFQKTISDKANQYKRDQGLKQQSTIFDLTKSKEEVDETASQRRQREIRESEANAKTFIMDRFSLDQIGKAHEEFKRIDQKMWANAIIGSMEYDKKQKGRKPQLDQDKVIKAMRDQPEYKEIMPIIDEPACLGIIKMISIFRKYQYEHEDDHINKILLSENNQNPDETNLTNESTVLLMQHIVRELSHIYKEVKQAKKTLNHQNTIQQTSNQSEIKQFESKEVFIHNMTGIEGFDDMKKEAVKRITQKIYQAGSIQKLPELLTPDDTLTHAMKQSLNANFSEQANATATKPQVIPENQRSGFRRAISQRQMSSLESFVRTAAFQEAFTEILKGIQFEAQKNKVSLLRAGEHVAKQAFYKVTKDSVAHNSKNHPNISFMKNCYDREVLPAPLFAKIEAGTLNLCGYYMSSGQAQALDIYLRQSFYNTGSHSKESPTDSSIIHTVVLHENGCSDENLASILSGLCVQKKLRHFHYSGNRFSQRSVEQLANVFEWEYPDNLKSLVLSRLTTHQFTLSKLLEEMCKMENLQKLVLHDLPLESCVPPTSFEDLTDPAESQQNISQNLVRFIFQNENIENLQLVNCKLRPETMFEICTRLERNQYLQNLSFRGNVLRVHKSNKQFIESLATLIRQSPALVHVDISGMNLKGDQILHIVKEGVLHSQTLAAFHFQENKVEEWTRLTIFKLMSRDDPDLYPDANDNEDGQSQLSISLSEEELKTVDSVHQLDKKTTVFDKEHVDQIVVKKNHLMRLDKGCHPVIKVQENIQEMVKANYSITQFYQSQMVIDSDIFKENKKEAGEESTIPEQSMHEDIVGTLYTRISARPQMYSDKANREHIFKGSKWQSVSADTGCWICNSSRQQHKLRMQVGHEK